MPVFPVEKKYKWKKTNISIVVTNLTGVLTIPKLRLNSLNIPSTGSLLVLTETALKEMKEIQRSFEHDLGRYRSVQVDVPIEKAALAHLQSEFDTDQETVIDRLIQDESNQIIKMFWTKGSIFTSFLIRKSWINE